MIKITVDKSPFELAMERVSLQLFRFRSRKYKELHRKITQRGEV